ncbi:MAG: aldehyde-activating protein, partial [Erythrobacter sp.]|nr:aldehyde-activating protein [Erythrobacter sp.]
MTPLHQGGCFCGAVRFTIAAEPQGARMCWCRDCQRIASGSATVNVLFDEEAVTYSGEMTRITRVADSGNTVERGFCSVCGSQM